MALAEVDFEEFKGRGELSKPFGLALGAVAAWREGGRVDVAAMRREVTARTAAKDAEWIRKWTLLRDCQALLAHKRRPAPATRERTASNHDGGNLVELLALRDAVKILNRPSTYKPVDERILASDHAEIYEHFRQARNEVLATSGWHFGNFPDAVERGRRLGEEFDHDPFKACRAKGLSVHLEEAPEPAAWYDPANDRRPGKVTVKAGSRGLRAALAAHELGHHVLCHTGKDTRGFWDDPEVAAEAFADAFMAVKRPV